MTVEVPTPLQRLSEIVEAGTPGDWKPWTSPEGTVTLRSTWRDGARMTAWPAVLQTARAHEDAAFASAAVRLARFLCSPEAVEVLARATYVARHPRETPPTWDDGFEADERWKASWRVAAASCLNTIVEQALKEPSRG